MTIVRGVLLTLRVNASVPAPRHSTLQQIRQGFRYILQQRLFLVLILLSYALSFFASSYMQLMPAFADMLAVDETGFGYLLSIGGIGASWAQSLQVPCSTPFTWGG